MKDPELLKLAPSVGEAPHELLLKTEFTSKYDFSQIAYGDNLGDKVFFCQRPDAHVRLAFSSVYADGHEVPSGDRSVSKADSAPSTYYVFLRIALEERGPSKPPFESFDLRRQPEDVCLVLEWGRYRKIGYTTNVVVVAANAIESALR